MVKAELGSVFIRADGSINPLTAPIQRNGDVYIFTNNVYDGIVVENDNIVVDGAGYTLQGRGSGKGIGIDLSERSNITIKNVEIKDFFYGINLFSSLNNSLTDNNLTGNSYSIRLHISSNNSVSRNMVTNSFYGLWLTDSSNNIIKENRLIKNSYYGLWLSTSSDYNRVSGNNITNNQFGILLDDYSNNIFRNNDLNENLYNIAVYGSLLPEFIQDIDESNTVNGKPIYYWVDKRDMTVPFDAGYVALVNCTQITVKNLDLNNNGEGILLAYTTNSTVTKNNITDNVHGIYLSKASNISITENRITENTANGIYLYYSLNNTFYSNNFINNKKQVYTVGVTRNVWDSGVKGNYWNNHKERYPDAEEIDGSGIWNIPYIIDMNNQDNLPAVPKFPVLN